MRTATRKAPATSALLRSCLELARDLAGSVRGRPADLSSNRRHLKGYGTSPAAERSRPA